MEIPTVKIEFNDKPSLIISQQEYKDIGKWHGLLKNYCISIRDVKKVHHILLDAKDYPTTEWEG